jgi:hypothetical protein
MASLLVTGIIKRRGLIFLILVASQTEYRKAYFKAGGYRFESRPNLRTKVFSGLQSFQLSSKWVIKILLFLLPNSASMSIMFGIIKIRFIKGY